MALVRGKEVFAQVVLEAGEHSLNRRMHEIKFHKGGKEMFKLEGNALPPLVLIHTTKNEHGKNVMEIFDQAPKSQSTEFSSTTLFLALISFIGLCAYVIVAAISAHRCLG